MHGNDRLNLRTNFIVSDVCEIENCTSRVPHLFLVLFLALESRCGARHYTYRISNVIKLAWLWSPSLRDVIAAAVAVGDTTRLRAMPLLMLTIEKGTLGFHNLYAFSSASLISINMGLRFPALGAGEAPPKI